MTTTAPNAFLNDPLLNALEGLRFRLSTLSSALDDYLRTISSTPTFPPWSVLSTKAANVSAGMTAVSEHLANHHGLFSDYGVFPNASFPGRTGPMVLMLLLRKKLEPGVEDWLQGGEKVASDWVKSKGAGGESGKLGLEQEEWESLWRGESKAGKGGNNGDDFVMEEEDEAESSRWLGVRNEMLDMGFRSQIGQLDYTSAEREMGVENVKTGLRRELRAEPADDEDESDEDDDESATEKRSTDDKMPVDSTAHDGLSTFDMNDYLKFLNMGIMPPAPTRAAPAARG